jgi:hypothetical protein
VCLDLRKRIDFHVASYPQSHDGADRAWITLDGELIYSFGWHPGWSKGVRCDAVQEFGYGARAFLDVDVPSALASEDPVFKALAILDRRVGKRTLRKMVLEDNAHPLVRAFFELRRASHSPREATSKEAVA